MQRFSIIIPVYNVAPYLRECLDSIVQQSFTDWECICVDDGSTDGSGAILDKYAKKKVGQESRSTADGQRLKVLHQKNSGVSAARNSGIAAATGEWMLFLDADDILFEDALFEIKKIIDSCDCDGVATHPLYRTSNPKTGQWTDRNATLGVPRSIADRKDLLLGKDAILGYPHGRIYRRELFTKIQFPVGVPMMEDLRHWVKAMTVPAKWVITEGCYYGYRHREGSALGGGRTVRFYLAIFEMPAAIMPILMDEIQFSRSDLRLFWRQFKDSYTYFIHLLSHFWYNFSCEERTRILNAYMDMQRTMGRCPADIFSRVQMWCLRNGIGSRTDWWYQHFEVFLDRYVRRVKIFG